MNIPGKYLIPTKKEIDDTKKIIEEIESSKYKIYTSKELYSIFLEIIKGNNTYPKLSKITGKKRPQIVAIAQPLIKTGIIEKTKNTGVPGKPLEFILKEKPLILLIQNHISESGYTDSLVGWGNIALKIRDFIYSKNNLFSARNFEDLSKMAFSHICSSKQEKIDILFH